MNDGNLRVALLARAGDACDRIGDALREAGADLVLVADPAAAGEAAVRDAQPQAIMVALEPAIEDALEAFDDLLADPAYLVIFEEAELAAQRAGWDAARWMRHLSAKLHRHGDVLPPGGEDEGDLQPSPGPLPPRREEVDLDQAIVAVTGEAQQRADEVPRDIGIEGLPSGDANAASSYDPLAWETGEPPATDAIAAVAADGPSPFDPVAFELGATDAAAGAASDFDLSGFSLAGDAPGAASSAGAGDAPDVAEATPGTPDADAAGFDLSGLSLVEDAPDAGSDGADFPRPQAQAPDTGEDGVAIDSGAPVDAEAHGIPTDGLSLAAEDDLPVIVRNDEASASAEQFDARISGLSLADPDSYGHGPERGAVLVDAGLGGPDAVRQLLAAIPPGFPRAIVVRLQLDGGRYDRLVRQMARAAALPVELATANAEAVAGQVYFLPPELGLRRDRGRLWFDPDTAGQLLPDAVPPADSALLLLSGASRRIADATDAADWSSALVAGQSPDGSYDPDAALALMERGGTTGTPGELAAMLAGRWPPPGASDANPEDLQP